MDDRITDERLREIVADDAKYFPWSLARELAIELLAARSDLSEAVMLLRNLQKGYLLQESWAEMEDTYRRIGALFDKHKETP